MRCSESGVERLIYLQEFCRRSWTLPTGAGNKHKHLNHHWRLQTATERFVFSDTHPGQACLRGRWEIHGLRDVGAWRDENGLKIKIEVKINLLTITQMFSHVEIKHSLKIKTSFFTGKLMIIQQILLLVFLYPCFGCGPAENGSSSSEELPSSPAPPSGWFFPDWTESEGRKSNSATDSVCVCVD